MKKNNISEYIKLCLVKKDDISVRQLALESGQTPQNLQNKMTRNSFKISELEKLADALDADLEIKFIDRKTGEAII